MHAAVQSEAGSGGGRPFATSGTLRYAHISDGQHLGRGWS